MKVDVDALRQRPDWEKIKGAAIHARNGRLQRYLATETRQQAAEIGAAVRAYLTKPQAPASRTHLIIPDCHVGPDQDLSRFKWLGALIGEREPDLVVCLGDFADCKSLSRHDELKHAAWGNYYVNDVNSVHHGLEVFGEAIHKHSRGGYKPETAITLGNHDNYPNRLANEKPSLYGHISTADWEYDRLFDIVAPFLTPYIADGVLYQHYIPSNTGRALGGVNIANTLIRKMHTSVVVGHTHRYDYKQATRATGERFFCLSAGWFGASQMPAYMSDVGFRSWWNGVHMLHSVRDGFGDLESISIERLQAMYG